MTTAPIPSPERVRDYILRRLPEEERGRFEEEYFGDDALLERVEAEEDRLVSDYVLGRLPEGDRRRFEEALLGTPYYRQRVETTGGLRLQAARRPSPPGRPGGAVERPTGTDRAGRHRVTLLPGQTGTGVAFVLLFCLLVAAVLAAWTLRRDLVALRRKVAAAAASSAAASAASVSPPYSATHAAFLLLDDAGLDGPPARRLPAEGGAVVLVVPAYRLPAESRTATFVLLDESGAPAWRSAELARSEQAAGGVVAQLPAGLPVSGRGALLLVPDPAAGPGRLLAVLLRDEPGN